MKITNQGELLPPGWKVSDVVKNQVSGHVSNYYLNEMTTLKKLKGHALRTKPMTEGLTKDNSFSFQFSTGGYMCAVGPLLSFWKESEGHPIDEDDTDGLKVVVLKVEPKKEKGGKIIEHIVRLEVESELVTITLYDTQVLVRVQGKRWMEEFTKRALKPYFGYEIKKQTSLIKEINQHFQQLGTVGYSNSRNGRTVAPNRAKRKTNYKDTRVQCEQQLEDTDIDSSGLEISISSENSLSLEEHVVGNNPVKLPYVNEKISLIPDDSFCLENNLNPAPKAVWVDLNMPEDWSTKKNRLTSGSLPSSDLQVILKAAADAGALGPPLPECSTPRPGQLATAHQRPKVAQVLLAEELLQEMISSVPSLGTPSSPPPGSTLSFPPRAGNPPSIPQFRLEGSDIHPQEVVIQLEGTVTTSGGLEDEAQKDQVQTLATKQGNPQGPLMEAGSVSLNQAGTPSEASGDQVQSSDTQSEGAGQYDGVLEIRKQIEQVHSSVQLERITSPVVGTQPHVAATSAGGMEARTQNEQVSSHGLERGNSSAQEVVTQPAGVGTAAAGLEIMTPIVLDPWRPTHDTTGDVLRFLTEMRKQSERLTIMEKREQKMETMIESQGHAIAALQQTLLKVAGRLDVEPGLGLPVDPRNPLGAAAVPVRMPRAPQPSDHQPRGSHSRVSMPRSSSPVHGARPRLPAQEARLPADLPVHPSPKMRPTLKCDACDHKTTSERRMDNHVRNFHTHTEASSNRKTFTLMVGDSHLSSVSRSEVERGLGRGARLVTPGASRPREDRAYCSTPDWPGAWFKQNSLQQMVPELLGERKYSNLILIAPTNDISNLREVGSRKERERLAIQSARNTLWVAEEALKSVEEVLIMEQPTRADELAELSEFSASKLREFAGRSRMAGRIKVGSNRSDCCTTEDQKTLVFGELSSSKVDGIHMKGEDGRKFLTETVVEATKVAGLADRDSRMGGASQPARGMERQEQGWSRVVGGPRPAARVENQRTSWADVASNRFQMLSN